MNLRDYILSEKNIYLAIYAVNSYVFDPQLLDIADKEMLCKLADPFNEDVINPLINEIREELEKVLNENNYLFDCQVYFKPKDYTGEGPVFRPIHTAKLKQLVSMVALLHPLIYEIPDEDNNKLYLSNYSRLIPNNFYGNRVSKHPEELFKKWNEQYKKYTQIANEYFKTFHESNEYKCEIKLDLENFFPSIDPLIVYSILMEKIPITIQDKQDLEIFKKIIYKLLVCNVTNINTDTASEYYYEQIISNKTYTRGIPQGLPQSYFFGNICMIKIAEIFQKKYKGKSVYYVDDSYLYTNEKITDIDDFMKQLNNINIEIKKFEEEYLEKGKNEKSFFSESNYKSFSNDLFEGKNHYYSIKVHEDSKSDYTAIDNIEDGEMYLRSLSREASQIGVDINSSFSEEEEETLLNKTRALLQSINQELKTDLTNKKIYKEKLERYYKFFRYREIRLQIKSEKNINTSLFNILVDKEKSDNKNGNSTVDFYSLLDRGISKESFFEKYKNDIWQVAMSLLIKNTGNTDKQIMIRKYIQKIIETVYHHEMFECSYVKKIYDSYLNDEEIIVAKDIYYTLKRKVNRKMVYFSNLTSKAIKYEFNHVKLKDLRKDIFSSYDILTSNFVNVIKLVVCNSDRLQRLYLNALYSILFKVDVSDHVIINSYDKKGITYGELRVLVYLRNYNCEVDKFLNWDIELLDGDNTQDIDFMLLKALNSYQKYVKDPAYIDNLILVHKYTCDVWKNGAKHLYFYTLHNQEHAVDLIQNIIKIVKTVSYLKITNYDYYLLFISCYLHDISMVKIASKNDFVLDNDESGKIVTSFEQKWDNKIASAYKKNELFQIYKEIDNYFENKIRSRHVAESAEEIRTRADLKFLELGVRESVAEIAESHGADVRDIYFVKGQAKSKLISFKFDQILLRFADLLDMSESRVSRPILNHNIDNISDLSAFHWVSHLLTEGYELISYYEMNGQKNENYLEPGNITEQIVLTIYVKLSQFSQIDNNKCKAGKIVEQSISSNGFEIEMNSDGDLCNSKKCNFLCRWFYEKNKYIIEEMQALENYLNRIPVNERFYNAKIKIKVVITNSTDISDEQFSILKQKIAESKES